MGIAALTVTLRSSVAPAQRARVVGTLTAAFGLAQIVGPLVAGVIAERSGSFAGSLMMAAAVVVRGALLLTVGVTKAGRLGGSKNVTDTVRPAD